MAIQCGFFDSVNSDRLYRADDMTKPYENLISNGVFATQNGTPSSYLQVVENGDGFNVTVKSGRGIFKNKWFINDTDINLTLADSEVVLNRIDSIIVKIDTSETVRAGTIEVKKGTPASSPVAPTMERSTNVYEYRLADIRLNAGVTTIRQANITDQRGSADCPWVTSLIKQVDTSTLLAQWQDAYKQFYDDSGAEFDTWFQNLHETVATQTLIRSFTSWYQTTVEDETVIPINIIQYNSELDILQVYINGLMLVENLDYTIPSHPAENITLTRPLDIGQQVSFVVYKSVDGSKAETVIGEVFELQSLVEVIKPVSDTGSTKWSVSAGTSVLTRFIEAGRGWHTWYAPANALDMPTNQTCRMFGHLTAQSSGSEAGWIIAMTVTGRVYANYLNNGSWIGWKDLTISMNDITASNGSVKISITDTTKNVLDEFLNAGTGVHSLYSATGVQGTPKSGAFRYLGQLTSASNGWIMAFNADGSVYSNYIVGGTWKGWKSIYDVDNLPLWTGQSFMQENANIKPSKKLSECAHGWVLVWADYDDATSTANQFNVVTQVVPKLNAVGNAWNGSSFMCVLPTNANEDGSYNMTVKQIYINDDHITGFAGNNVGNLNRGVVLRAIYEY